VKYCKKCLTTNLRPNFSFDAEGVCIACKYYRNNNKKSFLPKLKVLKTMVQENKKRRKKHFKYDCIVGVSGGKDSTRQAHRYLDRLEGTSDIASLDTGFHLVDPINKASKFFSIYDVTDINSLIVINK
jgi:hypothetical protein